MIALLLAGGKSSRFQYQDKSQLKVSLTIDSAIKSPQTLLQYNISYLQQLPQILPLDDILISCNQQQAKQPAFQSLAQSLNQPLLVDKEFPEQGPLSGIYQGLLWCKNNRQQHLFSLTVDTLNLPTEKLPQLITAYPLTLARCCHKIHYTIGVWHISLLPIIEQQLQTQQNAIRKLLTLTKYQIIQISDTPILNINTPSCLPTPTEIDTNQLKFTLTEIHTH